MQATCYYNNNNKYGDEAKLYMKAIFTEITPRNPPLN